MQGADEEALFKQMEDKARQALKPPSSAQILATTMARSNDPRMQALSGHVQHDFANTRFLLSLLGSADAAVLEAAADTLWKSAVAAPTRERIGALGGCQQMVGLLFHSEPKVQRVAAGGCTLLALEPALRPQIVAAGGAGALTALLASDNERVAEQAAKAIANLSSEDPERLSLVQAATPARLAALISRARAPTSLLEAGCRALAAVLNGGSVGGGAEAADAFCRSAGVAPLVQLLQVRGDVEAVPALARVAARAVQRLAAQGGVAAKQLLDAGALQPLCFLLQPHGADAAVSAAGALGAFALSPALRSALVGGGRAVPLLARCLDARASPELREASAAALRMLTLSGAAAQAQLADERVVVALVAMLESGELPLQEAAAALTGSMALHPQGRKQLLANQAAVEALCKLLTARNDAAVEAAARALRNLALDGDASSQVAAAGGMGPLVRMLRSRSENIHEAAAAALEVLSMDEMRRVELLRTQPQVPPT